MEIRLWGGGVVLKSGWGNSIIGAGKAPYHIPPLIRGKSVMRPLLTYIRLSLRHSLELSLLEDPWKSVESADLG